MSKFSHPAHAATVTKNTIGMSATAAFAWYMTCRLSVNTIAAHQPARGSYSREQNP